MESLGIKELSIIEKIIESANHLRASISVQYSGRDADETFKNYGITYDH